MSTINANTALQILRTELQEIESRILEGQVTYNPQRRRGRGSFGDVYLGQHEGTVSYQRWFLLGGILMLPFYKRTSA